MLKSKTRNDAKLHKKRKTLRSRAALKVGRVVPVLLLGMVAAGVQAQTNFGGLLGTVTDSSGATVAGATVTLTNTGTGESRTAVTEGGGTYNFVNLVPGAYRVHVQKESFQSFDDLDTGVQIGGTTRVDASLAPGNIQDTVTVTSQTPLIQTDSSSLGGVVEGKAVLQTPLNGRNVNNLLTLIPGVIAGGSTTGNPFGNTSNGAVTNAIAYGNYQIGGGFGGQSGFYVDGVQSNVPENNTNALIPTQDAVQEFRVSTNNVSAEFGGFAGGVVNLGIKSGTSSLHGSAYEYFRNSVLNANDWFSNHNSTQKPPLRQNQFGANLGGPVIKDGTFFFFAFEREAVRSGYASINTVPTLAEQGGDFSAIAAPIYDRYTAGTPQFQCNGRLNVICPNRIDPSATKILTTEYPNPNRSGLLNNYVVLAHTGASQNQYNARIDHNFGSRDSLFGRYTYWNPGSTPSDPFGTGVGYGLSGSKTHQAVIGDTLTANAKTVVDVRASYLRFYMYQQPLSRGYDIGNLGSNYAALAGPFGATELPALGIAGYSAAAQNSQLYWTNNVYSLLGSVTRIEGRHTVKAGGIVRSVQWTTAPNNQGLNFTTTAAFTANPAVSGSGNGLASFLIGVPSATSVSQVGGARSFLHNYGFYVTDTYQASRNLTLNLGLRWDQPGAYSEVNNNSTVLLPNAPNQLGTIFNPALNRSQALTGTLAFVDSSQYSSRRTEDLHWLLFAPRVGFAYRLTDASVVRAGYGISYLPSTLSQDGPTTSSVNSATTSIPNVAGVTPVSTLSNPLPSGILQPTRRDPAGLTALLGQIINSPVTHQPYGNVQQWNAVFEQAFGSHTSFSLGYAGSKGTHLFLEGSGTQSRLNLNQIPDTDLSLGSALATQVANPFYGTIHSGPLAAANVAEGYLLLPHPEFQQVYETTPRLGASTYHTLQATLTRRFSHGGTLGVAYTWSKLLANTDSITTFLDGVTAAGTIQDNNNLRAERSISLQDLPQSVIVNYGVELPFGHGERFLHDSSGLLGAAASGWRVNGITSFHSGQPLAMLAGSTTLSSSFGAGNIRPNVSSHCSKAISGDASGRQARWFNTGCFSSPGSYAFGNEARVDSLLRAGGIANWDFSATKATQIHKKLNMEFSAEFFNLFNRVQFAAPDTNLSDGTFGQVSAQTNSPRNIQFALRSTF